MKTMKLITPRNFLRLRYSSLPVIKNILTHLYSMLLTSLMSLVTVINTDHEA